MHFESYEHPARAVPFVVVSMLVAFLFTLAAAMAERAGHRTWPRGVAERCDSRDCVAPHQLITSAEALRLKRLLSDSALLVDIRAAAEAPAALALRGDVRAPFMQPAGESGMEFRADFGHNVDEALRAAGMRHDEPVILMSPSVERAVLAALLLQERGYSSVLVVRD
jgi:hypothetical protein